MLLSSLFWLDVMTMSLVLWERKKKEKTWQGIQRRMVGFWNQELDFTDIDVPGLWRHLLKGIISYILLCEANNQMQKWQTFSPWHIQSTVCGSYRYGWWELEKKDIVDWREGRRPKVRNNSSTPYSHCIQVTWKIKICRDSGSIRVRYKNFYWLGGNSFL